MLGIVLLGAMVLVALAVGSVARRGLGSAAGHGGAPDRSGLQLRYRRSAQRAPGWEPQRVTAGALRDRGLGPWPDAVGIWWPEPPPAGALVCRPCLDHPARLRAAIADRDDAERGLVLLGEGARHRVDRRCVLHTTRAL